MNKGCSGGCPILAIASTFACRHGTGSRTPPCVMRCLPLRHTCLFLLSFPCANRSRRPLFYPSLTWRMRLSVCMYICMIRVYVCMYIQLQVERRRGHWRRHAAFDRAAAHYARAVQQDESTAAWLQLARSISEGHSLQSTLAESAAQGDNRLLV